MDEEDQTRSFKEFVGRVIDLGLADRGGGVVERFPADLRFRTKVEQQPHLNHPRRFQVV